MKRGIPWCWILPPAAAALCLGYVLGARCLASDPAPEGRPLESGPAADGEAAARMDAAIAHFQRWAMPEGEAARNDGAAPGAPWRHLGADPAGVINVLRARGLDAYEAHAVLALGFLRHGPAGGEAYLEWAGRGGVEPSDAGAVAELLGYMPEPWVAGLLLSPAARSAAPEKARWTALTHQIILLPRLQAQRIWRALAEELDASLGSGGEASAARLGLLAAAAFMQGESAAQKLLLDPRIFGDDPKEAIRIATRARTPEAYNFIQSMFAAHGDPAIASQAQQALLFWDRP